MTTLPLASSTGLKKDELRRRLLAGLVLLLALYLTFRPVLSAGFLLWDDDQMVFLNQRLQSPTFASLSAFWKETNTCNLGLFSPLSYSLWWCIARIWGLSEPAFHATNLVLHGINVLLVFALLERLLRARMATSVILPASAGAMLFALHPIQVEAVAWVSGMNNLLAAVFALLSLVLLCQSAGTTSRRRRWLAYTVATVCLILGLLAKPTALVTPLLGWTLLVLVFRQPARRAAMWMLPWAAISIPFVMLGSAAQPLVDVPYPWWMRFLVTADTYAFYWLKILVPYPLLPDYARNHIVVAGQWLTKPLWLATPLLLGLVVLWWRRGWLWPAVVAGLLGLSIAPVSGIRPFFFQIYSTVADRYAYLAMLAPATALAALLASRIRRPVLMLTVAALLALALLANRQTRVWADTFTWTDYVISHQPTSTIAHCTRANLLHVYGRNSEALDEIDVALRYAAGNAKYHHIRAEILMDLGRPGDALREITSLIEQTPAYQGAYGLLVDVAEKTGRLDIALDILRTTVGQKPNSPSAHAALASALRRAGVVDQAMQHALTAIALDPGNQLAGKEVQALSNGPAKPKLDVGKLTVPPVQ